MDRYIAIENNARPVNLRDIPVLDYHSFQKLVSELLEQADHHCVLYYAIRYSDHYKFICCIGTDAEKKIFVFSHEQENKPGLVLESLTQSHFELHIFEREIAENFDITFSGHPWLKPVRFPADRYDTGKVIENYPFYSIHSEELHEVGVGPVHAGIIEPGHFRFICHGENVLHLEIQLGYQHRGIEKLFLEKSHTLQRTVLSESIAGDTTIGHALCHVSLMESLAGIETSDKLAMERAIALELERIAVHIGDTAALCGDVAYQFGQVVNEALRTIVINTTQLWCGNRFGKGLIRTGGTRYPLTTEIATQAVKNLQEVRERYVQICERIFSLPSVLARFENTGRVTDIQARMIGAVGMAARSSGIKRDIRWSHPFGYFRQMEYEPVLLNKGDVWSRAMLRKLEVEESIEMVIGIIQNKLTGDLPSVPVFELNLQPSAFVLSLTEGWRGEICHAAITDESGSLVHYKVKDPSMHNWLALALAVRKQEISDFPLCNKSYNLSYCGNDL